MNDLKNDWPNDPCNDELLQLAAQLQSAPPALPADALSRVEQRMHAELNRAERRQRWRSVVFGCSIAASILIAVGGYVVFRMSGDAGHSAQPTVHQSPVEDHVTIAVGVSSLSSPNEKALVRLDEYRSLFAD